MNIGTPLSGSATRVMLLGAGEPGKEVIIALQRLGVETLAVDRYDNAPGHQVAHRAYTIDMTGGPALRALIEAEKPMLMVPEIEAIATDTLAKIERDGITEIIPTARAAQLTMNREGIRRLAAEELELPTSRYAFVDSLHQLQMAIDSGAGYPCIVKPVMSSSGKGQSTIHDPADVQADWDYAMSGGRVSGARVIVEEQIDFDDEITLLTVRALDNDGEIQTHFCEPIGHRQEQGDYVESWQPQAMSATALTRARNIAKKVTGSLGGCGLFGVELFIKDEQVWCGVTYKVYLSAWREAVSGKARLAGNGVPFSRDAPTVGALGDTADDGFPPRPEGGPQMPPRHGHGDNGQPVAE